MVSEPEARRWNARFVRRQTINAKNAAENQRERCLQSDQKNSSLYRQRSSKAAHSWALEAAMEAVRGCCFLLGVWLWPRWREVVTHHDLEEEEEDEESAEWEDISGEERCPSDVISSCLRVENKILSARRGERTELTGTVENCFPGAGDWIWKRSKIDVTCDTGGKRWRGETDEDSLHFLFCEITVPLSDSSKKKKKKMSLPSNSYGCLPKRRLGSDTTFTGVVTGFYSVTSLIFCLVGQMAEGSDDNQSSWKTAKRCRKTSRGMCKQSAAPWPSRTPV